MTESFFTITEPATGVVKEKGSKFIAFAHPVTDSEQIKTALDALKKQYFDATHHCYAWVLGAEKKHFRSFDDGEPNHSAGDPILGQIRSKNLTDILIVVVRYFGGTKLGVSGLITSYKAAAAEALTKANIIEKFVLKQFVIEFEYQETSIVMNLINEFELKIHSQNFNERCLITVDAKIKMAAPLLVKIETLRAQRYTIQIKPQQVSL